MTTRDEILARAQQCVSGDRDGTYGAPEDSFAAIGVLWQAYLGIDLDQHDVALLLALMKIARAKANPQHDDSWVDLAGYAACGGEVARREGGA